MTQNLDGGLDPHGEPYLRPGAPPTRYQHDYQRAARMALDWRTDPITRALFDPKYRAPLILPPDPWASEAEPDRLDCDG